MKDVQDVTIAQLAELVQKCHMLHECSWDGKKYKVQYPDAAAQVCGDSYHKKVIGMVYLCTAYGELCDHLTT